MKRIALICLVTCLGSATFAQTFTSSAAGSFSTGSNWAGGTAPPLSGQSFGSVTVQNNMSITGNYTVGSFALNVSSGSTLTINGNLNFTNSGGTIDVYGTLIVTGTFTASANAGSFVIHPGGVVDVYGATTINNNSVISVGTNASPPPYADLILEGNVTFASGGAGLTVNKNGRVAVYGNLTSSGGGGQTLQINNGGQMYVNGNIALTGNGDNINSNNTVPYGLFVNGTTTNTGGGASTSNFIGNKTTMQTTDASFYSWVQSQHNSPLPITLTYFGVSTITTTSIALTWTTSSELNFDHFELEKSADGKTFIAIGEVKGHGTTQSTHTYQFTDPQPYVGVSYYRLKSIDFDGFTETFTSVAALFEGNQEAVIYPNPLTSRTLHVDFNFEPTSESVVVITDMLGNTKSTLTTSGVQNTFSLSLDPGMYVLTVVSGKFKDVRRIVISE